MVSFFVRASTLHVISLVLITGTGRCRGLTSARWKAGKCNSWLPTVWIQHDPPVLLRPDSHWFHSINHQSGWEGNQWNQWLGYVGLPFILAFAILVWIAGTGLSKRTERLKQKQVWRGSETERNGIQRDSAVSWDWEKRDKGMAKVRRSRLIKTRRLLLELWKPFCAAIWLCPLGFVGVSSTEQFAFRTRCPGPGSSNSHFVDKFIPAQQQLSQRCTNRASGVNWVQQHPDEDILMGSHGSVAMEALELGGWTSTSQVPHLISPHVWSTDIPSHITWNPPMARSTCRPRRQRQLVQLEMRQLISGVRDFGPQGPQGEVNSFAPGIPGPRLRASFWNVLMTSRTIPFHSRSCSVCVEVAFVQAAWISQRVHHQGVANTWGQP